MASEAKNLVLGVPKPFKPCCAYHPKELHVVCRLSHVLATFCKLSMDIVIHIGVKVHTFPKAQQIGLDDSHWKFAPNSLSQSNNIIQSLAN
jgi:hypothetical protein